MKYLLTQFRLKQAAWVFLFLFLPFLGFPLFFRPNGYLSPVQVVSTQGDVYPLDWHVVETEGVMSEEAADRVERVISQQQSAGKKAVLLLPTGNTPKGMYRSLVRRTKEGRIHWKDVTIFMLDEYMGGDDYDRYIHENFVDQLPENNRPTIFVLNGKAENLEAECGDYERRINEAGGVDLAVLGIGVEGHIGFNEKGSGRGTRTRKIQLAESTIKTNPEVAEKGYTHAVTVGVATILSSREIILLANKPTKAAILERLWGEVPHADNPATWLKTHPKVTVLLDIQAAVRLPAESLGLSDIMTYMIYSEIARQFNAPVGGRGIFEELFKDKDPKTGQPLERGGWVHRPWEILKFDLPEQIERRVNELKTEGVQTLGFVAMGGESSIIGPSTDSILNISSTSPRKLRRLIGNRDLKAIRWFVVSKSGGTKETKNNAAYLERLYQQKGLDPQRYITYVTDPGTEMEKEKSKEGFTVEHRELGDQTTVGGRNTLVNNPTLLAYAWRNPGDLRKMLLALTGAHTFGQKTEDPWIKAAAEVAPLMQKGRSKLAVILPEKLRQDLWIWLQQNPEESLGKKNSGFTVYTSRPDLRTLKSMADAGWIFVEFQVAGEEAATQEYAGQAKKDGHPVIVIPIKGENPLFIPQVVSYGWMKFVSVVGALSGINFSDQPPVEEYKKLMRQKELHLQDAISHAGTAVARDAKITLVYDGLLPFLADENNKDKDYDYAEKRKALEEEIERLKAKDASPAAIFAKLLRSTSWKFDAQTLAYYDDVDEVTAGILERVSQEQIHQGLGFAGKWGEGTGVLHGLFVNWFSGRLHQIPIQVIAADRDQPELSYPAGAQILEEGAVAAHLSLVEAKRPSVMLIVNGRLDDNAGVIERFFEEVHAHFIESIFGRGSGYDIRGQASKAPELGPKNDVTLTPSVAELIGKVLGSRHSVGARVLVTGDHRESSAPLREALIEGLVSTGMDVTTTDEYVPTGAASRKALADGFALTVQITGSHNPWHGNGLKITEKQNEQGQPDPKGIPSALSEQGLVELYQAINAHHWRGNVPVTWSPRQVNGLVDEYINSLDAILPRLRYRRVVIDSGNGVGGRAMAELLRRRGIEVVEIFNEPHPRFPNHPADPSKDDINAPYDESGVRYASEKVRKLNAGLTPGEVRYIAVVIDGDGDRGAYLDEDGNPIAPERLLAAFYHRFILENQAAISKLKAVGHNIQLALDVRASALVMRILNHYDIKGVFIPGGYPSHRKFVRQQITEIKRVAAENGLGEDPDIQHLINTYTSAEASGHYFYATDPTHPDVKVDDGIYSAVLGLYIVDTAAEYETRSSAVSLPEREFYTFETFFAPFNPQVNLDLPVTTTDIRDDVNDLAKFDIVRQAREEVRERFHERMRPTEGVIEVGGLKTQIPEDGLVEVDGMRVQLQDGSWVLLRASNTSAKLTYKVEAPTRAQLVPLMEEILEILESFGPQGLATVKFAKELQKEKNILQREEEVRHQVLLQAV